MGEFLALAVSLEDLAEKTGNDKLKSVAAALDIANGKYLSENKGPSRKVNEIDNRGSHYYLARYWAEALAASDNADLKSEFAGLAEALNSNEAKIVEELNSVQGKAMDIGGYYQPDEAKTEAAMRPSATLNAAVDAV